MGPWAIDRTCPRPKRDICRLPLAVPYCLERSARPQPPTRGINASGAIESIPTDETYRLTVLYRSALSIAVIKSFVDKRTAAIFVGYAVRDLPQQIQRRARAKLLAIDAASLLDDIRIPPGNRLEALHGNRQGQFSVRVNDQWRICFVWRESEAWNVEIVDYH